MALYDSADCIRRAKLRLNRPASDAAFTVSTPDDILYDFATEEQDEITKLCASFIPDALITAPTAMTSADGGITYTFGTDVDSAQIFALGLFQVYASRSDIPDAPLVPGIDFMVEGTKIRMTNNAARTFGDGGPWTQTVNPSNVMASGTQPSIPKILRTCLIARTAARGAKRLGMDPSEHEQDAEASFLSVVAAVKKQAMSKGGATLQDRPSSWWQRRRI